MKLPLKLSVINVGLESFTKPFEGLGVDFTHCKWRPPAAGELDVCRALAELTLSPVVEEANRTAYGRYLNSSPALFGAGEARELIPAFREGKLLLHSGPPIEWADMCGPQRGALMGAALLEGWCKSAGEAEEMLRAGEIKLAPTSAYNAVGPMAGVISAGMPLWIVKDTASGKSSFSNFNEGLGKVLRFGANDDSVLERLRWMREALLPLIAECFKETGPLELKPLMAQALHMGDELHNRNAASTGLLFKKLAPVMAWRSGAADALKFIASNDHFFLNISMAACKSMLSEAEGVPYSSMVTAMSRNGVNFGIQIAAFKDKWFEAPAGFIKGLYFPGFGEADAARDLGDSAITETAGLGGFSMAAAPAIVRFVGGSSEDAVSNTLSMQNITLGLNNAFTLPMLDFKGAPAGIDIRLVIDSGILPVINTGIAHREAGVGQIGAGLTEAPSACFNKALLALREEVA